MTANVFSLHTAQPASQRGLIALSKVCFPSLLSSSHPSCRSMRHCAFSFGWEMLLPCCRCLQNKRLDSTGCWKPPFIPYQSRFRTSLFIQSSFLALFGGQCCHPLKKYVRNPESTWWFGQDFTIEGGIDGLLSKVSVDSHPEAGLKKAMLYIEQMFGGKAEAGATDIQSNSSEVPGLAAKSLVWQPSLTA